MCNESHNVGKWTVEFRLDLWEGLLVQFDTSIESEGETLTVSEEGTFNEWTNTLRRSNSDEPIYEKVFKPTFIKDAEYDLNQEYVMEGYSADGSYGSSFVETFNVLPGLIKGSFWDMGSSGMWGSFHLAQNDGMNYLHVSI